MKSKITINPLFLIQGIGCYIFNIFDLWLFSMFCSFVSEFGQTMLCRDQDFDRFCIHFTPIAVKVEDVLPTFYPKLQYHLIGSAIAIFIAITMFAFDFNVYCKCSMFVALFRLLPILPLQGGKFMLDVLGRCFGTLKVAVILTKIGLGFGYGVCIFSVFISFAFDFLILLLPIGGYLIFANKKMLYPIIRRLYDGLAIHCEKPLKEVNVNGDESPQELSFYLTPFYETIFFAKDKRGVSEQKVIVGLLEEKDASWLWKAKKI